MKAYLQLIRAPNLITSVTDVVAGFALMTWMADAPCEPRWHKLLALMFISAALYASGVIFNDCLDIDKDRGLRSDRPLPRGAISLRRAFALGSTLTFAALGIAMFLSWSAVFCSGALIVSIWTYNVPLRRNPFSSALALGLCRFLNMVLGMSTGVSISYFSFKNYPELFLAPAILGAYAAIVTLVSTYEDRPAGRFGAWALLASAGGMAAVLLAAIFGVTKTLMGRLMLAALAVILVGIITAPLTRLTFASVRRAVGIAVMLIIVFDAAIVLGIHDAPTWLGLVMLLSLAPAILMSRKLSPS